MSIYDDVLDFIASPEPGKFEPLAIAVFRHQFAGVRGYREHCAALGISMADVKGVDEIPSVSTLAFKYAQLASEARAGGEKVFMTSGTTIGGSERGRHIVPRPEIYRASAIAHFRAMMFPERRTMPILAMHPTADRMPESSLSQMITWCIEEFGTARSACVADRHRVDTAAARDFLDHMQRDREPVCILGTTASLAALFRALEADRARIELPLGSRVMDTGGAKGQQTPLDAAAVCARARDLLGIAPDFVINEYGMTELCSQLYDATSFNSDDDSPPAVRVKIAPAWMRAAAIDPITLRPVTAGEIGMLRLFDLANVGSVSAILTEDFGIVNEAGDRVRILGRAGLAEPRGCALAIEEFEAAENQRSSQ